MEEEREQQAVCRSVFRDGRTETDTNAYTAAWGALIDRAERRKGSCTGAERGESGAR